MYEVSGTVVLIDRDVGAVDPDKGGCEVKLIGQLDLRSYLLLCKYFLSLPADVYC